MARDNNTLARVRGRWHTRCVKSLVVVAVGLAAGCHGTPAAPVDARQVFLTNCTRCHGPAGKPVGVMATQLHVQDLTDSAFRARVTPALVAHQVRTGSKNGQMPSFAGALSDAQIDALAKFVASPAFLDLSGPSR